MRRALLSFFVPMTTVATLILLGPACKKPGASSPGASSESGPRADVLAKIGERAITVGEVEDQINKMPPYVRTRYTAPEHKKEYLDNMVRFEVLAYEAFAKGFDKDPDVVRVWKQQAVSKLIQSILDKEYKPESVPKTEVQKYYDAHQDEFTQPEAVRVSDIVIKDEGKAKKVAAEAKADAQKKPSDEKAFTALVEKNSEDLGSKPRGGDLGFLDRKNARQPAALLDAAFAMKDVGEVAGPIKLDNNFHVIRLSAKRAGFVRPMAEVERSIQQHVYRDERGKKIDDLVDQIRKEANVTVNEDALKKVQIDTNVSNQGATRGVLPTEATLHIPTARPPGGTPSPAGAGAPAPGVAPAAAAPAAHP